MPKLSSEAQLAVKSLEDLKGLDIKTLDVRKLTTVTDWMIICTGTSNRHVKSLAQNVIDQAKLAGERPRGIEGLEKGEWALVDLGGVVVHVMQVQARAFYQLEKLWDAPPPAPPKPVRVPKPPKPPKPRSGKPARKPAGKKRAAAPRRRK